MSLAVGIVVLNMWHGETGAYALAHMTKIDKNQIWPARTAPGMNRCALIACLAV